MTTPLSQQLHAALQIIYDAYDRVYDIASHRWHEEDFYHHELQQSSLLGHYVRKLARFQDHAPTHITADQYDEYSKPLADAIDLVLDAIYHAGGMKPHRLIRNICAYKTTFFMQPSTYARCMSVFRTIEQAYPRALHRDGAPSGRRKKPLSTSKSKHTEHSTYRRPQRTARWTPYKD